MQMMLNAKRGTRKGKSRFWTCRVGNKSDFNVNRRNAGGDEVTRTFLERAVRDDVN